MIGKFQIQLGAEQMTSGMASTDFATDGALSVTSTGLNPFVTPGVMYGMSSPTTLTVATGNVIASCEDSQSISNYNRTWIDDQGNYYTFALPTITKTNTATTNVAHYTQALTDMVSFAGNTYVTTDNGDIDQWNTSGTPTLTNSWWVGTKSQSAMNSNVPHPMLSYAGNLYIADRNKIHGINSALTINTFFPALPFTLNSNEVIYALGIDPLTGLMMISVQTIISISAGLSAKYFIYLWDGVSAQFYRKIPTDDLVTAFHNVEGNVFCPFGTNLGQWNGNGVSFLRKFKNVNQTSGDLVYKHHITNSRNVLHIADGKDVLSYGTVIAGEKKAFFYTANTQTTNHINALFPVGDYNFIVADNSHNILLWSLTNTAAGSPNMAFNNTYFPRPVYIRRVRIITTGLTAAVSGIGNVIVTDEKQNTYQAQPGGNLGFIVPSGKTYYVFDFDFSSCKLQGFSLAESWNAQAFGIIRTIIYYDIAE